MTDEIAAKNAIRDLDGGSVEGKTIRVEEAKPKDNSGFSGDSFKSKSPFKKQGNGW